MTTITAVPDGVILGVDTHKDAHVAAVCDGVGRVIATGSFPTDTAGYTNLADWAESFGSISQAGIEGTGSWGSGLCRFLTDRGVECVEVGRPNRQHRRRHGKSDTADAVGAARSVLSGEATGAPRGNTTNIESMRVIRVALRSAIRSRSQALNQLHALIVTAPETIRSQLKPLNRADMVAAAAGFRPGGGTGPVSVTKSALRSIARRVVYLNNEIGELEAARQRLVEHTAPDELTNELGVGPAVAADLLIAYGSNPDRVMSEASFAALCGVSPIDASSGRQHRHRLNRGGDRHANCALWRIVMVRLSCHPETRRFYEQKISEGKTKKEAIRILKRVIARRVWRILNQHPPRLDNP